MFHLPPHGTTNIPSFSTTHDRIHREGDLAYCSLHVRVRHGNCPRGRGRMHLTSTHTSRSYSHQDMPGKLPVCVDATPRPWTCKCTETIDVDLPKEAKALEGCSRQDFTSIHKLYIIPTLPSDISTKEHNTKSVAHLLSVLCFHVHHAFHLHQLQPWGFPPCFPRQCQPHSFG